MRFCLEWTLHSMEKSHSVSVYRVCICVNRERERHSNVRPEYEMKKRLKNSFTSCRLRFRSLFKMNGVVPFALILARVERKGVGRGEGRGGVERSLF